MSEAPEKIWLDAFNKGVPDLADDVCWPWTGTKLGRGYGSCRVRGSKPTGAHRVSWALANGRWPEPGQVVMHSCDNPPCVNPAHLSVGTQKDNMQDCSRKGRVKPFVPPPATHCKNGHEYSSENTIIQKSSSGTYRRCRACKKAAQQRWKESRNV